MIVKDIFKKIYFRIQAIKPPKSFEKYYLENIRMLDEAKDDEPLKQLEMNANRHRILQYYKTHDGSKYQSEIDFLKEHVSHWMICTDELAKFRKNFVDEIETIQFDYKRELYYAVRNGRKMYFKRSMDKETAIRYFTITCFEQSSHSAHRYLDKDFNVEEGSIVLDVGAAEGIFGLDVIDKVKELYLFECDDEWIEALQYTFEGYDNVEIVKSYVSDVDTEDCVTLDSYCDRLKQEKVFIKMDIEGAEIKAVNGAQKLLQCADGLKLAVCAYHRQSDYERLCGLLKTMKLDKSEGYLCPLFGKIIPPYFRVGVIRATKAGRQNEENY